MAQQVSVKLVDDIDGSEASGTVSFGLDGAQYEIDLSDDNAGKLRDALAAFVGSARRAGGGRARAVVAPRVARPGASDRVRTAAIREWARQNGHAISDRGRIPSSVVEAYGQRDAAPAEPVEVDEAPKKPRKRTMKVAS